MDQGDDTEKKGKFEKGTSGNPNGRPKGSQNRSTTLAREAIARFVDANAERLQDWLDRIAEENPKGAFDCLMAVCEYHIPKLSRADVALSGNLTVQRIDNLGAETGKQPHDTNP